MEQSTGENNPEDVNFKLFEVIRSIHNLVGRLCEVDNRLRSIETASADSRRTILAQPNPSSVRLMPGHAEGEDTGGPESSAVAQPRRIGPDHIGGFDLKVNNVRKKDRPVFSLLRPKLRCQGDKSAGSHLPPARLFFSRSKPTCLASRMKVGRSIFTYDTGRTSAQEGVVGRSSIHQSREQPKYQELR